MAIEVDDLSHTYLSELLGTLIAGEVGHIDLCPTELSVESAVVEHSVTLSMDHIGVLGVQWVIGYLVPGELVIGPAVGRTVVAKAQDPILSRYDAGSHLSRGVLRPIGYEESHPHEGVIPAGSNSRWHSILGDDIAIRVDWLKGIARSYPHEIRLDSLVDKVPSIVKGHIELVGKWLEDLG